MTRIPQDAAAHQGAGLVAASPGTSGYVLRADRLSKTYAGQMALREASLSVRRGSVHGLVGGNGSGKSTMVKILAGVLSADEGGAIEIDGTRHPAHKMTPAIAKSSGLHVVHQELGVFPDLSVAENLRIGQSFPVTRAGRIPWRTVHADAQRILERFDLDIDPALPIGRLRPAEQTVVAIARALQDQEDAHSGVLILDEPTAALTAAEVDLLLANLRRYADRGQSILFISHRLDEVCAISDEVTVLRDGRDVATVTSRELSTDMLAQLIVGRPVTPPVRPTAPATRSPRLRVRELSGGSLRQLSFDVNAGEIVGIAGLLGSGRSRVLRTLFGLEPARSGTIELDGTVVQFGTPLAALKSGVALVPEDRAVDAAFAEQAVTFNLSAADIGRYWTHGKLRHRAERKDAASDIAAYGIVTAGVTAPIVTLSGGNQQKVIVARSLRLRPRLLLLDEPSQGVDVGARLELHNILRAAAAAGTAAIVVSSDFTELADLCDRVLVLVGGTIAHEVAGDRLDPSELTRLAYLPAEAPLP